MNFPNFVIPILKGMGKTFVWILIIWIWPWSLPLLQVVEATTQISYPGRKESPVYTRYDIMVIAGKPSKKLKINRLYIKKQPSPVSVLTWPGGKVVYSFAKGDTLLIRADYFEPKPGKSHEEEVILPSSFRKYEVVIGCRVRNKNKFIPVKKIRRLPDKMNL